MHDHHPDDTESGQPNSAGQADSTDQPGGAGQSGNGGQADRASQPDSAGQADGTGHPFPPGKSDAPLDGDGEWRALPDRMRRVWMVNEIITAAITLVVCAVVAVICLINDWWNIWQPLVLALIAGYVVLEVAFQPLQTTYAYAYYRFAIGEHDLRIRKGWLFRSSVTVPLNRVQHIDTKQNPVLRRFGLTTVVVHTAVSEHEIEALDADEAERMVRLITERVALAKEDL